MYEVANLLLDSCHEVVKGLEITRTAGLDGNLLAGLAASAVGHNHVDHAAHADLTDIGVALQSAFQVGLYAAAGSPVPGLRQRNALVQKHLDTCIIVIDGRHGASHADALGCLSQEGIRVLGNAVADSHVGLFERGVHGGLDGHVGQVVDCVIAVTVDTACADLNGHVVSCGESCGCAVLEEAHLCDLDPEAVHQLLCAVLGKDTVCDIFVVVVNQVLVHTAQVIGRSVLLHEDAVLIGKHGLKRLIEVAGRLLRNVAVDFRNLKKLCLSLLVLLLRCHLLSQVSVTICQGNDTFRGNDEGLIENHLLQNIFAACSVQGSQLLFCFLLDAAYALSEKGSPAGGVLAVAADKLLVNIEHAAVAHGADVIGHHRIPAVKDTFASPVGSNLFHEELLVLFGKIEGVILSGADGVQLSLDNRAGRIGIQDSGTGLECHAADKELIVLDEDGLVLINHLHGSCLLDGPRLTLGGLEALGYIVSIFDIHLYSVGQVVFSQCIDSLHVRFAHRFFLLKAFCFYLKHSLYTHCKFSVLPCIRATSLPKHR